MQTAQAARDLGLFLLKEGDRAAARRALREALRLDEAESGPASAQTLEDSATLAGISPAAEAEPLFRRAAESGDASVAGPALAALAGYRKSAGDRAGAAVLYRRAVTKAEALEGRNGTTVALVLMQLAAVADSDEALAALRRAVAIDRQVLGDQDARTVAAVKTLTTMEGRGNVKGGGR